MATLPLLIDMDSQPIGATARPIPALVGGCGSNRSPQGAYIGFSDRYAREGSKSLELAINNDGSNLTYRSEIAWDAPDGIGCPGICSGLLDGDEIWYAFSMLIPPEVSIIDPVTRDGETIFQLHARLPESGFPLSPGVSMAIDNCRVILDQRYTPVLNGNASTQIVVANNVDLCGISKGVWNDFIVHIKLQHSAPGVTEVWVNRLLKYRNTTHPNTNNRSPEYTGYLKNGSYVPGRRDGNEIPTSDPRSLRRIFFSSLRGTSGPTASLADLSPPVPLSLPDSAVALSLL